MDEQELLEQALFDERQERERTASEEIARLTAALAASEAREKAMREALEIADYELGQHESCDFAVCRKGYPSHVRDQVRAALSTPSDGGSDG